MRKLVPLLACGLAAPFAAQAAPPSLSDVLGTSGIAVAGHVDASYTIGFNKGQTLALRAFDTESDSFVLNQAFLNVSSAPAEGFGGTATVLVGSDGAAVNTSYVQGGGDFSLVQGFLQYGSGPFTFMAGRYVTLAGFEVIDSTADTNISRSLLFQNAEPLVHTGVRTAFKAGDKATFYLGLNNSAVTGKALDDNKEKTAEFGLSLTPSSAFSLAFYDYYGIDPGVHKTNYFDVVASLQASSAVQLALNADWARTIGTDSTTAGLAAYLNIGWSDSFKTSLRAEYLQFTNVLPTGGAAACSSSKCNVYEATLTGDYSASKNFDFLAEFRVDKAKDEIFPNPGVADFKKTQPDVAFKLIYKFGTPTGS